LIVPAVAAYADTARVVAAEASGIVAGEEPELEAPAATPPLKIRVIMICGS
jgi:hypothetical protein